jgi:hypothetical protein
LQHRHHHHRVHSSLTIMYLLTQKLALLNGDLTPGCCCGYYIDNVNGTM